jgi:hypothetical protein
MRTTTMIWADDVYGRVKGDQEPCVCCGRPLKGRVWAVHVINGGSDVLHPADEHLYQSDGGDLYSHFVGPECRKKFRRVRRGVGRPAGDRGRRAPNVGVTTRGGRRGVQGHRPREAREPDSREPACAPVGWLD